MDKFINALKGKSKTINFNALVIALVGISGAFGYEVPTELVTAITTIGNMILRFVTTKALDEK